MIDFKLQMDIKQMKILLSAPKVHVGIYRDAPLFSYHKDLVLLMQGGSQRANRENKAQRWGTHTVAKTFDSVVMGTPLRQKYVEAELKRTGDDIFVRFFRSNQQKNDVKMYENNCSAVVKKAYLNMSKCMRNHPTRIKQKGHALYGIGTGQTFKAIKGRVKY